MRSLRRLGLSLALAAFGAGAALACGYHQPVDLERGVLNLVYPDALYVPTAVWQAQQAGLLGPIDAAAAKDPFALHGATRRLEALGDVLAAKAAPDLHGLSLVQIDSMLWTRMAFADGRATTIVHSDGPQTGDAIVVTHDLVVRALVEGRMGGEQALSLGLIRLYGGEAEQGALAALFAALKANGS
jgi:hypothetical protein